MFDVFANLLEPALLAMSLLESYTTCSLSGKIIIWILLAGSVVAWTIMITNMTMLVRAKKASAHFLRAFRKGENPVELYTERFSMPDSPLFTIYTKGCRAVSDELELTEARSGLFDQPLAVQTLTERQLSAVQDVTTRSVAEQGSMLEKDMGLLRTAVTASPFLGLLGTVWGVMEAFAGMGDSAPTLQAVAPGISAALLTTVVGLLVALPSQVVLNLATHRIRAMNIELDNFGKEFVARLNRYFILDKPELGREA